MGYIKPVDKEIDGLGVIKLQPYLTMSNVINIDKLIVSNYSDREFIENILLDIIKHPKVTLEMLKTWSNQQLLELVEFWVRKWQKSELTVQDNLSFKDFKHIIIKYVENSMVRYNDLTKSLVESLTENNQNTISAISKFSNTTLLGQLSTGPALYLPYNYKNDPIFLPSISQSDTEPEDDESQIKRNSKIHQVLLHLSENLANSYEQVIIDLNDSTRKSWIGAAHEIREIYRGVVEKLATDEEVTKQVGFKFEFDNERKQLRTKPTQSQKFRYILKNQKQSSSEQELVEKVSSMIEFSVEAMRELYNRSSSAAHQFKGKKEARQLFRYLESFLHDLLNLD